MAKTDLRKELEREYKRLAKQADQRLVRLEKYAQETKFRGVLEFAYKVAMRDIKAWGGSGAKRFNIKAPENTNQLKAKIADIKKFLSADSSTLRATKTNKGVLSIYEKRAKTLNDKYGTNFSWQDLAKFFDSSINEKLDAQMSSDAKMEAIAVIQHNKEAVRKAIKASGEKHIDVDPEKVDSVVEFNVNQILNEFGKKDINKLFGSN